MKSASSKSTFFPIFGISIALHAILLLSLQGWIIFQAPPPPKNNHFYAFFEVVVPTETSESSETSETLTSTSLNQHTIDGSSQAYQSTSKFPLPENQESEAPKAKNILSSLSSEQIMDLDRNTFNEIQSQENIQPSTQLFGTHIEGDLIVFVIDASGSMLEKSGPDTRMKIAHMGVKNAISALKPYQRFNVILFANKLRILEKKPLYASIPNKAAAYRFLNHEVDIGGTTNLMTAMGKAIAMQPDSIIVITDGQANTSPEILLPQITHLRKKTLFKTAIHTIGFFLDPDEAHVATFLAQLSQNNNGTYNDWARNAPSTLAFQKKIHNSQPPPTVAEGPAE